MKSLQDTKLSMLDLVAVRENGTVAEALARGVEHSRVPLVTGGEATRISGLVFRRDIFDRLAAGERDTPLAALCRPVARLGEQTTADLVLRALRVEF